jgi:hypothetical protein
MPWERRVQSGRESNLGTRSSNQLLYRGSHWPCLRCAHGLECCTDTGFWLVRGGEAAFGSAAQGVEAFRLVWANVLGQARTWAGAPGRYLTLMAATGIVAAFAVVDHDSILIVGLWR